MKQLNHFEEVITASDKGTLDIYDYLEAVYMTVATNPEHSNSKDAVSDMRDMKTILTFLSTSTLSEEQKDKKYSFSQSWERSATSDNLILQIVSNDTGEDVVEQKLTIKRSSLPISSSKNEYDRFNQELYDFFRGFYLLIAKWQSNSQ